MVKSPTLKSLWYAFALLIFGATTLQASSHREAPLIANDPQADNVDVYAFRSPDNPDMITLIATYIPMQLPHGGPNYYWFGENIHYDIHVDNDVNTPGDDIIYRFVFDVENEDPSTFFNIRLGQQNLKNTYTLMRSMDGGATFETILEDGYVPPYNIGPRSITSGAGLGAGSYADLFQQGITATGTGEMAFAGTSDDPFFVDLGGIFDLGNAPRQDGDPRDGLACYNVSVLALQVPISTLRKPSAPATPTNILDSDYVIGVWASASRPAMRVLNGDGTMSESGDYVQVSRLGMPLTNEAVIPIGQKDFWNAISPYDEINETTLDQYFYNPELALYMGGGAFADAVPAFDPLNIQTASLAGLVGPDFPGFDFTNGADGLFPLKGSDLVAGTALDDAVFGNLLLPGPGQPRSVDLWPAFHTGVPNVVPYQLATGKMGGNPLTPGKPFVNNFLPNGGDMLRLNMAVPPTPRDDANFSSLGLIQAAAIGLTVAPFNTTADLEFLPNMDGFPNGRRLEDDVTRIELQAVSGVVLAAVGLFYDDYDVTDPDASPVTPTLLGVLGYTTGVEENDVPFMDAFPYVAMPRSGTGECSGQIVDNDDDGGNGGGDDDDDDDGVMLDGSATLYASSNTNNNIGVYAIDTAGTITASTFAGQAADADGIYYDESSDRLIQLNRTNNRLDVYQDVAATLADGGTPQVAFSSPIGQFSNGREIAVSGNRVVVAQDAAPSNNMENRLLIYDLGVNSINLTRNYLVDFNLWGLTIDGNKLKAVEDNSNRLRIFNNIFASTVGNTISSDVTITFEGLVRTHGIDYDADNNVVVMTDIGDAGSDSDGAFIVVYDFTTAAADGTISLSEQIRVSGAPLGNPVDVAYDHDRARVYIAERANGGGQILGYDIPMMSGVGSPFYTASFPGASAVYLNVTGSSTPQGGDGVDLELSVEADDDAYTIFENTVFTYTLTNNGTMNATNVVVSTPFPQGFVHTSNSTTAGTYNLFFKEWTVPVVAPGQSVTLTLNLFALVGSGEVTAYAQVVSQDQNDDDSFPNNGNGQTPNEDDEAAVTLGASALGGGNPANAVVSAEVYPTLVQTTSDVTLKLTAPTKGKVTILLMDAQGRPVRQQYEQASVGLNTFQVALPNVPQGQYLIQVMQSNQLVETEWIVVQ